MGAVKQMWIDEVDKISEDFAAGEISREDAVADLVQHGFDRSEANDMLDVADEEMNG